jgi:hypothetical protein
MAFFTADVEPGLVTRAVWNMFFKVLEFEMNAIGSWQSVNEGVFFRSALEKPWISLSLFSALGLERETYESFLSYRHRPPFDSFIQKPEYERRAAENELLLLSVSPPRNEVQSKEIIMQRNWIACNMADVVFIGGAEKASLQWSHRVNNLTPRRQKTYALAKRLAKNGIPVFTVDHPDNKDLFSLGIPGYTPETISGAFQSWGAKKGKTPAAKSMLPAESIVAPPAAGKRHFQDMGAQLSLFEDPAADD